MPDLEKQIAEWRRQMLATGIKTPVPLEELESHLREDVERRTKSGQGAQEAFRTAVQRIGQADALTEEFKKTGGVFKRLAVAPPQLLAYIIFVVTVALADWLTLLFSPTFLHAVLVPYTGWVASMFYNYTLYFAFQIIYQRQQRNAVRLLGITLMMLFQIGDGISQLSQMGGENFGNPYLTISPWRPVWTILIPCVWIVVLYSPRMNRFCRQEPETNLA